jgi:hypothetical protein
MTFTSLLSLFAYSTRYIAANIPRGAAIKRDISVTKMVFISAGRSETFSELYFHAKRFADKFGTPFIRIYPTSRSKTVAVIHAADTTEKKSMNESGFFL